MIAKESHTWSFVAHRGSAADKTASTSKSVSPNADVAVGRVLVVRVSSDNLATASGETNNHTSVTDSKSNTYTKLREQTYSAGVAADGVTGSLWICVISTALTTSDTVTVSFSGSITAKVIALEEFSKTANNITVLGANGNSQAASASPTVTLSGIEETEALWLGHVAIEGLNTDGFTQDSDYANNTSVGTTGGAGSANTASRFGSRINTATSDTYNPTLGIGRDVITILAAVKETGVTTYTKTWQSDVLFKKLGITKTAAIDTAFKKLGITKTYTADVLFKKTDIQLQKQVDALFKKLAILKQFGVDVALLQKDIVKTFAVDARFGATITHTLNRQIDALFKKFGITKAFAIDADFKKTLQIQKQVDSIFKKVSTITKQVDVLFKKFGITKAFAVDVWFGTVGAVAYTKTFAIDAMFRYKIKLPSPLGLTFDGQLVIPLKREVWVGD